MQKSSPAARIIGVAAALLFTPIALLLISLGGRRAAMLAELYGEGPDFFDTLGPGILAFGGAFLIGLVALTGVWTSAGLLTVGLFGVVFTGLAFAPTLLLPIYRAVRGVFGDESFDAVLYGVALETTWPLGFAGLGLFLLRHRKSRLSRPLEIISLVLSPVLLGGGGLLLYWGLSTGQIPTVVTVINPRIDPLTGLYLAGGLALTAAGALLVRFSRYALLLPGITLIVVGIVSLFPEPFLALSRLIPPLLRFAHLHFFVQGGGASLGLAFVLITVAAHRLAKRRDS